MIRRRSFHLWIALWLAVIFPISGFGQVLLGYGLTRPGQLSPTQNQTPAQTQHEEDETHSFAKATTKVAGRKLRRILLAQRFSVLPSLAVCQEQKHARRWGPAVTFRLPTSDFLDDSLSRRGPPSA